MFLLRIFPLSIPSSQSTISSMKPTLVCLFAHPDDEAFGPSGTIHAFTKMHDVYIICATNGDAGENHHPAGGTIDLGHQRKSEIIESSKVLGVKKVFFLEHKDGELSNNKYQTIATECRTILDDLRPQILLTFEHRGISGHIDHVFMAMVTSFLYERLSYVQEAHFYCLREDQHNKKPGEYFIYFPRGYKESEVDKTVDITKYLAVKKAAISKHISQTKDMKNILKSLRTKECFYIFKKDK